MRIKIVKYSAALEMAAMTYFRGFLIMAPTTSASGPTNRNILLRVTILSILDYVKI